MSEKSILLVDDEIIILNSIGKDLRQENYQVTQAESGEEAIELLQSNNFDLVITDLSMMRIDGIQVLEEAKRLNSLTAVIILTGYGDMESAIKSLRLGADDYLLKPCEHEDLLIRIKRCLDRQEMVLKIQGYEKILPVCAYCRNIRDDTGVDPGKGKWLSMEQYVYKTSKTAVSHGCCPDCYEKQSQMLKPFNQ